MDRRSRHPWTTGEHSGPTDDGASRRLLADGGEDQDSGDSETDGTSDGSANPALDADAGEDEATRLDGDPTAGDDDPDDDPANDPGDEPDGDPDDGSGLDRSNVEVTDAGGADPADPKWEKPDLDEIPEFEVGGREPTAGASGGADHQAGHDHGHGGEAEDPTAGRPNTARSPGESRIKREGTEGYIAALELCARLPEDVRLPEEAADLVPAAVEAELEQDVQSFAAAEFDDHSPHVDALEFVERGDEIWLRLRLGVPPGALDDLDPEEVRAHALQELEGLI